MKPRSDFHGASPIAAVMVHVADVGAALAWYQRAFPDSVRTTIEESGFEALVLDGVNLEFVMADEKVSSGAQGSVVYWRVHDFGLVLTRLEGLGATLFRGPMRIEAGWSMCQVRDPWGNCIGLRGPCRLSGKDTGVDGSPTGPHRRSTSAGSE